MIRYVIATAFMAVPGIVTAGSSAFLGRALPQRHLQSTVQYLGCFAYDNDRVLESGYRSFLMTLETCYGFCTEAGASYMGLRLGYECDCGFTEHVVMQIEARDDCDKPCLGDDTNDPATCGGEASFDLYAIGGEDEPGSLAPTSTPTSSPTPVLSDDTEQLAAPPEFQDLLDLHNEARCVHGTGPVQWSDDVMEVARAHVELLTNPDNCGSLSSSNLDEHGLGENRYNCYTYSGVPGETNCYNAEDAMETLYSSGVTNGTVTEYDDRTARVLWQSTANLGCAVGSCDLEGYDISMSILVCNYSPRGDYLNPLVVEVEVKEPTKTAEECKQLVEDDSTTPAPSTSAVPIPSTLSPNPTPTPAPLTPPTPAPVTPEPTPSPVTPTNAPVAEPNPPPAPAPVQPSPGVGACDPNPCLNGGSCDLDSSGLYTCSCAEAFAGMNCETDTTTFPEFFITVDFVGTWTDSRKAVFESAANRWSEVITHIPCTGTNSNGGAAGELRISSSLDEIDGPGNFLGYAAPTGVWEDCPGISFSGAMGFDIDDIAPMEENGSLESVILHEMGHAIGIGSLWGDCSDCEATLSPEWKCPLTAQVYNGLIGNSPGSPANIIETTGGAGTRCSHFSERIFGNELMTGSIEAIPNNELVTGSIERSSSPISKLTAASLADQGYVVNMAMTDDYILPSKRPSLVQGGGTEMFEILESTEHVNYVVSNSEGVIVEVVDGVRFRF